jgi:Flp pilus assembly pilin Flp
VLVRSDSESTCASAPRGAECRFKRDDGLTVIEYALIAALIMVVIVGAVRMLGIETCKPYQSIATGMAQ